MQLSFSSEFLKAVRNGISRANGGPLLFPSEPEKRQSVREFRRDGRDGKRGETLYLTGGPYRKGCSRSLGNVKCIQAASIVLTRETISADFARLEGFRDIDYALEYFARAGILADEFAPAVTWRGMLYRW